MSNNPLSNMSYTNKDFNSIYKELLDLVKTLTYKWDPSVSNESDPGNILLKLNAIIGDKNNYNIDKNILENFPETLTQDISARSLYKQLAYRMPWYQAATTDITFKWIGKDANEITDLSSSVNIDKFQLITDANNEFVYTTLEDVTFTKLNKTHSVKAMEGIITTLTLNGQPFIELNNLDHYNRVYFNETTVAENGIFIYNLNGSENDYWTMVDNLQVEPLGRKNFEFGIDSRKNLCYVEFPSDINTLIGNGLVIKYIVTNGSEGNIISKTLDRFYEDVSVEVNGEDVVLDRNVLYINNESATTNGSDPEDLHTAYNNYRKTAGTFHTLVTLRDYINAVYNSGLVSNVKVCDRLTDVQSTYEIVPDNTYGNDVITQQANSGHRGYIGYAKTGTIYNEKPDINVAKFFTYTDGQMQTVTDDNWNDNWRDTYTLVTEDVNDLQAFDLKLYMLHSPGEVETYNQYISTFDMESYNSQAYNNVLSYIQEQQCVQHDFVSILPNIPCLFKNSFPLNIKIIPHYKLVSEQINELKININKALFHNLNAYYSEFGEEPSYDKIYDIIFNADDRIKALILDEFNYTTYATYWDGIEFKDIPISELKAENIKLYNSRNDITKEILDSLKQDLGDMLFKNLYFITKDNKIYRIDYKDELVEYSSFMQQFRTDIIAKSILAGRTPFAKVDNLFQYCVDQQKIELDSTDRVSTYIEIYPHGSVEKVDGETIDTQYKPVTIDVNNLDKYKSVSYKLGANENLRFLAPSFTTDKTYGNYVKYELILSETNKGIYEKDINLTYQDYQISPQEFDNKPIKYYKITDVETNDGTTKDVHTLFNKFTIPYDKEWRNWLTSEDKDSIVGTDIFNYGDRIITFGTTQADNKEKIQTIVDTGITLKKAIQTYGKVLLDKWESETYIVQSNLYISDLLEENVDPVNYKPNILDLKNGNAQMFYSINVATIPTDTDYELQENEYITFFYKEEDSDDAPYTFEKYGKGSIIKPSFPLQGVKNGEEKISINSLIGTSGFIQQSDLKTSQYYKISQLYGYNDLSGTKSIAIRKLNQVKIKANEYGSYYFITNNIVNNIINGKYVSQYMLQPDSNGCYTLNNEEYFIHLNEDRTMFEMLGAGTLLNFYKAGTTQVFTSPLYVNKVDYVEIANKGLSSFINSCKTLINGNGNESIDITITEQQLYNFSKDDIVTFTVKDSIFKNKETTETRQGLVIKTGTQTPIIDYDISYVSAGTRGTLPNISLTNSNYVWNATAILNLYCSYDEPQIIESSKENMVDEINGEDRGSVYRAIQIKNVVHSSNDIDLYLLCNISLNKVGGSNIDVTYLDSFGNRTKPFLYVYNINPTYTQAYRNTTLTKLVDGSIVVKLMNVKDKIIPLIITPYEDENVKIMLKIKNISANINFDIEVITDNGNLPLTPINSNNTNNGYGVYYYQVDSSLPIKDGKYNLRLTFSENEDLKAEDSLIIDTLCKFEYNDIFEKRYNITQDSINERIIHYDIDKVFDYTHKVNSDKYIEDPLDAKSFFNTAHIFNSFTIPMADLYMSEKSESNITLINNR